MGDYDDEPFRPYTRGGGRKTTAEVGPSSRQTTSTGKRKTPAFDDDYEEIDEDDEPLQKKAKSRAGTRSRFRLPSSEPDSSSGATSPKHDEFTKLVSETLQSTDISLKNTTLIANKLKDLKLSKVVEPFQPEQSEIHLSNLFSRQPVQGRDIRPKRRLNRSNESLWILSFKIGSTNTEPAGTSIRVPWSTLAQDASSDEVTAFHNELAKQYNCWPFELKDTGFPLKQMFFANAAQTLYATPQQIDQVYHSDGMTYQTRVHYIDADTGRHERITVSASASLKATAAVVIPEMPTLRVLDTKAESHTLRTDSNRTYLAAPTKLTAKQQQDTSLASQHLAEDAVYWVAQLQGLVATKKRMSELEIQYRESIGLRKGQGHKSGIYGGTGNLYTIHQWRSRLQTRIGPTVDMRTDLGVPERSGLSLKVFSLNANRSTPVLDTITQLFCAGHDLRFVWLEAAKAADYVNMDIADGTPPSSQCDCSDTDVSVELHACERCAKPVICASRSYNSAGQLVCTGCSVHDKLSTCESKAAGDSLASYVAHRSLWKNFVRECNIRQLDPKANKTIFDVAVQKIKQRLPGKGIFAAAPANLGTHYVDEWTGMTFDIAEERPLLGNNPSRRRYHPQGLTIDTIRREGHPDNHSLKHSGDNLAITNNVCQMGHGSFNPGVMHEIAKFKALPEAEQQTEKSQKVLVQSTTAMAAVECKRKYINAGEGSKLAKYQKIIAEAVAGQPTANEHGPWEDHSVRFVARKVPAYQPDGENLWDEETWERTQKCAKSTEKLFGVKLYRLADGTLWRGNASTNPKELDRNGVAALCQERVKRERTVCNKKWQTHDNDEKLYQEIIFQYCCSVTTKGNLLWLKKKYGDRLGLPLVLSWNNPLRLSVAHRHHGFGMFAGWISDSPVDVQERMDNDSANNMLIESWYVNSSKLDMAEEYYDQLDEILCKVSITNVEIYNPSRQAPTPVMDVVPSQQSLVKDEFDGAVFDIAASADDEAEDGDVEGDLDEEMLGVGPAGATEAPDEEMLGVDPVGADEDDLNQTVSDLYQIIVDNKVLRGLLVSDQVLRSLLAQLQTLADDETGGSEIEEKFNEIFEQVSNEYIDVHVTDA